MIKIDSFKQYIGTISEEELLQLGTNIYMITTSLRNDYPNYSEWFFNKQLPETINSEKRNILFVRNSENMVISMACLKKDGIEQKICTLYVSAKYRGLGIGEAVVEEAIKWLGTTKPFITFADSKLEMFKPIINKYGWNLIQIVPNFYKDGVQELCFNGTLIKNNDAILEQAFQKDFMRVLNI